MSFFGRTMSVLFLEHGAHSSNLATLSLASMPYSFKFLIAPFVDAVSFLLLKFLFSKALFQVSGEKKIIYCSNAVFGKVLIAKSYSMKSFLLFALHSHTLLRIKSKH